MNNDTQGIQQEGWLLQESEEVGIKQKKRSKSEACSAGIAFQESDLKRFWPKVERSDGCWLWKAGKNLQGYGMICMKKHGMTHLSAHKFSWLLHHGPIPIGLCVLHKCDTPACVNPDHLWLGTHKDNSEDMVIKGRVCRGRRHKILHNGCSLSGDDHPFRKNPLLVQRGDNHYSRRRPELRTRGERHGR